MPLVIIVGSVLAGLTWWFLPGFTRLPRAPGTPGPRPGTGGGCIPAGRASDRLNGGRMRGPRPGGPAAEAELDDHVEVMRQLAALLLSGRHPGEAWMLLETSWSLRIPAAAGPGARAREQKRGHRGPRATSPVAARDIMEGCRAARISSETGAGPSAGLERHLRAHQAFEHAWERLLWCIRLSESTGAPLVDLLQRLADQLEAEQDRRRALEAALAGARMTQKLLAWLPALGLGLAQLMGADPLGVLTGTVLGRVCLAAGGGLWWANALWCRRLLATARPQMPQRQRRGVRREARRP